MRTMAEAFHQDDKGHDLLSQILDMEKAANAKLTGIAVSGT